MATRFPIPGIRIAWRSLGQSLWLRKRTVPRVRSAPRATWSRKKPACGGSPCGSWCCSPLALAAVLWEPLQSVPYHLGAIAPALLLLVVLFAAYVYGRRREVSDLKVLLKDLQDRVGVAPSEEQLDQLSQVILRSQRSFKELIDSFDDIACAVSLDGTFRTVNRQV